MRAIHNMISVAVSAAAHVELYDFRMLEYFWAEEVKLIWRPSRPLLQLINQRSIDCSVTILMNTYLNALMKSTNVLCIYSQY